MQKYLLLTILLLLTATPVLAHKIKVSAYATSGTVYVEGRYPDDRPVSDARILVRDSKGRVLIKDQADENGQYSFPVANKETLEITVGDRLGHRTTVKLRRSVIEAGRD